MRALFGRCFMLRISLVHVQLWHDNSLRCGNWHACCLRNISRSLKSTFCQLPSYTPCAWPFNNATCFTHLVIGTHAHHWRLWGSCLLTKPKEVSSFPWRHSLIGCREKRIGWRLSIKHTLSSFFHLLSLKLHKIYLIERLEIILRLVSFDFSRLFIPEKVLH